MTHFHKPRPPRLRKLSAVAVLALATALIAGCHSSSPASPPMPSPSFDSATRDDTEFNSTFRHKFADVGDVTMHYVVGGQGTPLVLLHGWPQSWYEWRPIMAQLAEKHTVYAVDLPGLGDSQGKPTGYDKATLARYVHQLITTVANGQQVGLVGHDLGAAVAFRYAAQYPGDVDKLAYLDLPLPGPAIDARQYRALSWHIAFHSQPTVPETLVAGHVRQYLDLFYPQVAYRGTAFGGTGTRSPFTAAQVDEFTRTYSRPEVLSGGFDLYRSLDKDVADNLAVDPISAPTMVMTAEGQLATIRATLEPRAAAITRAVEVPRAGHWLVEENPKFVISELLAFFAS